MYVSSIIFKYGDTDNVRRDAQTVMEIMARQGASLLIDVTAEETGASANRLNLDDASRSNVIRSLVDEFKSALQERL